MMKRAAAKPTLFSLFSPVPSKRDKTCNDLAAAAAAAVLFATVVLFIGKISLEIEMERTPYCTRNGRRKCRRVTWRHFQLLCALPSSPLSQPLQNCISYTEARCHIDSKVEWNRVAVRRRCRTTTTTVRVSPPRPSSREELLAILEILFMMVQYSCSLCNWTCEKRQVASTHSARVVPLLQTFSNRPTDRRSIQGATTSESSRVDCKR